MAFLWRLHLRTILFSELDVVRVCPQTWFLCIRKCVLWLSRVLKLVFPKLLSYVLRTNILASWQSNKGLGSKSFMICKYTSLKVFNFSSYTYKLTISCLSQQWNLIYFILISLFHKTIFPPAFFLLLQIPRLFSTLELRNNENKLLSIR